MNRSADPDDARTLARHIAEAVVLRKGDPESFVESTAEYIEEHLIQYGDARAKEGAAARQAEIVAGIRHALARPNSVLTVESENVARWIETGEIGDHLPTAPSAETESKPCGACGGNKVVMSYAFGDEEPPTPIACQYCKGSGRTSGEHE